MLINGPRREKLFWESIWLISDKVRTRDCISSHVQERELVLGGPQIQWTIVCWSDLLCLQAALSIHGMCGWANAGPCSPGNLVPFCELEGKPAHSPLCTLPSWDQAQTLSLSSVLLGKAICLCQKKMRSSSIKVDLNRALALQSLNLWVCIKSRKQSKSQSWNIICYGINANLLGLEFLSSKLRAHKMKYKTDTKIRNSLVKTQLWKLKSVNFLL